MGVEPARLVNSRRSPPTTKVDGAGLGDLTGLHSGHWRVVGSTDLVQTPPVDSRRGAGEHSGAD